MKNKKIIGATVCTDGSITFKSLLEKRVFNYLREEGFDPKYEYKKFILLQSFLPITPFYDRETKSQHSKRLKESGKRDSRGLRLCDKSILPITYTPDIYIRYGNLDIWIECKGFENDSFPLKKKMFINLLDNIQLTTGQKSMYFEVYTIKQVTEAIEIIKNYE